MDLQYTLYINSGLSNSKYGSDFKEHAGKSVIRLYYRYRYVQLWQRTAICIGRVRVICTVHRTNIKHKGQTYFAPCDV